MSATRVSQTAPGSGVEDIGPALLDTDPNHFSLACPGQVRWIDPRGEQLAPQAEIDGRIRAGALAVLNRQREGAGGVAQGLSQRAEMFGPQAQYDAVALSGRVVLT